MIPDFYKNIDARLVPIRKGTKSPGVAGWPKIQDRFQEANSKFDKNIHNKVGWILDDRHLVIDIDTLQRLSDDIGIDLYDHANVIVRTPTGGSHLYFYKDPELKVPKSSSEYPGLDFLTGGSQVITAGSWHDSVTGYYQFERGADVTDLRVLAASVFADAMATSGQAQPTMTDPQQGERPGDQFNKSERALQHLKFAMMGQGYSFRAKPECDEFVRPGKEPAGSAFSISGTLGRKSKQGNYILRNFSTNDTNFPSDQSITIFEAFRLINVFDNSEVVKHISDMGFGTKEDTTVVQQSVDDWLASVPETKNRVDQLSSTEIARRVECLTFSELKKSVCLRRPYVIDGLLRDGEIMNIIAPPKVGKSWLVYNLALATSCGKEFLGYSASRGLNVLLIDNELHWEELTWRVEQVAKHMNVNPGNSLSMSCVRGMDISLAGIEKLLDEIDGDQFDLIIIDALYRVLPKGASENDNAQMTQLYNRLDGIAAKNNSAIICIHHTSKGSQGNKDITDVGAGAGAISRAADTHLTFRPHRDEPYFVIDAVTRSGQSPEPVVAEFDWPIWETAADVLPELKQDGPPSKESQKEQQVALCLDLVSRDSETSFSALAGEMKVSEGVVRGICKKMQEDRLIEIEKRPYKPSIVRPAEPLETGNRQS